MYDGQIVVRPTGNDRVDVLGFRKLLDDSAGVEICSKTHDLRFTLYESNEAAQEAKRTFLAPTNPSSLSNAITSTELK